MGCSSAPRPKLVHRVFQFTDTTVRAFMVPRPRILALDIEMPPDQVLARVVEYGRTRPGRTSGGGRR
jgi:CBS domain containing-hemolysin-like protein